jgi:hypothetical protein
LLSTAAAAGMAEAVEATPADSAAAMRAGSAVATLQGSQAAMQVALEAIVVDMRVVASTTLPTLVAIHQDFAAAASLPYMHTAT